MVIKKAMTASEDLKFAKELARVKKMRECSERDLAANLGRSNTFVHDHLALNRLWPDERQMYLKKRMCKSVAMRLPRLPIRARWKVIGMLKGGEQVTLKMVSTRMSTGRLPHALLPDGVKGEGSDRRLRLQIDVPWLPGQFQMLRKNLEKLVRSLPDAVVTAAQCVWEDAEPGHVGQKKDFQPITRGRNYPSGG